MPDVSQAADDLRRRLGARELRSMLEGFVRRRVPPGEVDDVVQTVLVDALATSQLPGDEASLRRWVVGIARHKVADFHRKNGRTKTVELPEQLPGEEAPIAAREWAEWADKHTDGDPDAQRTLDWMAREGGGEKLAQIAADEQLPPTQVRQRVSRMRRHLKAQWKAELAAVAMLIVLALVAWRVLRDPTPQAITPEPDRVVPAPIEPAPEVEPSPLDRAADLRRAALEDCAGERWQACLDGLDAARALDPAGDEVEAVRQARQGAEAALNPPLDPPRDPPPPVKKNETPIAPPVQKSAPPRKTSDAPPTNSPPSNILPTKPTPQQQTYPQKPQGKKTSGGFDPKK